HPPPPHLQARAAQGASTRQAVLDYITAHGPGVSTNQIAADLGKARSTVREHRDRLHQEGHQVYEN
uniref:winged helix-turn-helix domain-containing protein n=1 Tax=Nocardiopsis halophila TaxID=141692 RepID=UPI000476D291